MIFQAMSERSAKVSQQGGERQESSGIVGECGKEERSDTSAVSPLSSPSPLLSFALHRRAVKRWLSFFISRFDFAHMSIVGCYSAAPHCYLPRRVGFPATSSCLR